ncbi:protein-glutamate methylesterase/protein-glutamine glutaminase [Defluviitalea phaphyphila]|uniref:protein-glutamate methylesterase/protein-glutamine glutaminase n=1 Tax=Defluviitalea phaphyphila TaxID=1473580 RepID=UPI000ADCC253|nr:chemotaxis response regulator protein-glutamate methylesterase [Defluviitalea phaphyphila]
MIKKKKILVIDDSAFMRRVISDIINSDNRLIVVGTAKNGKEGLRKIKELNPDVITTDIEMPTMNGLEMIKILMETTPKPVLVISAFTKEGADTTIKALELGAVDFITKPENIFKINKEETKKQILEKIITASNIRNLPHKNIKNIRKDIKNIEKNTIKKESIKEYGKYLRKIVAIGTSTGGPRALQEVLPYIPKTLPASYVIVQHMPPGFTKSLSERLNSLSDITVKEAKDKDILYPGVAYIAPGDYHILIEKANNSSDYWIRLSSSPPVAGHRPSVNVMFNSLIETNFNDIIGVIMTGMGTDGLEGMKNLKRKKNAFIIAQEEKSCVVYGMPRAVIEAGIADVVVPLHKIAKEIIKVVEVF